MCEYEGTSMIVHMYMCAHTMGVLPILCDNKHAHAHTRLFFTKFPLASVCPCSQALSRWLVLLPSKF